MDEGRQHGGGLQQQPGRVASHLLPEIHVHLIAAIPNGLVVEEYMPWTWRLVRGSADAAVVNGEIAVPTGPGLGLKFAPGFVFEKYGVG